MSDNSFDIYDSFHTCTSRYLAYLASGDSDNITYMEECNALNTGKGVLGVIQSYIDAVLIGDTSEDHVKYVMSIHDKLERGEIIVNFEGDFTSLISEIEYKTSLKFPGLTKQLRNYSKVSNYIKNNSDRVKRGVKRNNYFNKKRKIQKAQKEIGYVSGDIFNTSEIRKSIIVTIMDSINKGIFTEDMRTALSELSYDTDIYLIEEKLKKKNMFNDLRVVDEPGIVN